MAEQTPDASEGEQSVVTFKVGVFDEERTFVIHKDIVCQQSSFFDKTFKNRFKEGKEQVLIFPETDIEVFKVLMRWFYTHELPYRPDEDEVYLGTWECDDTSQEFRWDFLMSSVYVISKTYDITRLSHQIEHSFKGSFYDNGCPSKSTIIRVFENVPEDSPLCQTLVERFVRFWATESEETERNQFSHLPLNFTLMALEAFAKYRNRLQEELDAKDQKINEMTDAALAQGSPPIYKQRRGKEKGLDVIP